MTGHGNIDLCRRAFKNGAHEFLTKPVDADLLFEVVGDAMARQQMALDAQKRLQPLQQKLAALTAREKERLGEIVQGDSSKEIDQRRSR